MRELTGPFHPGFGPAAADGLAAVLKGAASASRLQILALVAGSPDGLCPVDIVPELDLTQPTVSSHLRVLTAAGLLTREKTAVWTVYRVDPAAFTALAGLLTPPGSRRLPGPGGAS